MSNEQAGKASPSRFSLQQLSTSTRNRVTIDTGCQRCQHCMMRRLWLQRGVTKALNTDQDVSSGIPEEIGSRPC